MWRFSTVADKLLACSNHGVGEGARNRGAQSDAGGKARRGRKSTQATMEQSSFMFSCLLATYASLNR